MFDARKLLDQLAGSGAAGGFAGGLGLETGLVRQLEAAVESSTTA